MDRTSYAYRQCVGAYFDMATTDATRLVPAHLTPLELQPGRSVLAVTAFEFTESVVGSYDEVVLAIVVAPVVEPGESPPKAAFFPFMVATSTEESRQHGIDLWHLPHHAKAVDIRFTRGREPGEVGATTVAVRDEGKPVLELTVTDAEFKPARDVYSCFSVSEDERYRVSVVMDAAHAEHRDGGGSLTLCEHPMTAGLTVEQIEPRPLTEECYRDGRQTFDPLQRF